MNSPAASLPPSRLLVAANNYLALVCVKTHRFKVITRIDGSDCFYGVTQDDQGTILVAQTATGEIWGYDENLENRRLYLRIKADPSPRLHQIAWWKGRLYVPVTRKDRFEIYEEGKRVGRVHLSDRPTEDIHHPNSVNIIDGTLAVVAHNQSISPSAIYRFDLSLRSIGYAELSDARDAHNVWRRDDGVYVLSSKTNRVLRCDKQLKVKCVCELEPGTWARGLAESATHTFVGLSKGAGKEDRVRRFPGEIEIYDRSWKKLDVIKLPGAGQIHEIRLIGEQDAGHADRIMTVNARMDE